jgi:hypothetical protein
MTARPSSTTVCPCTSCRVHRLQEASHFTLEVRAYTTCQDKICSLMIYSTKRNGHSLLWILVLVCPTRGRLLVETRISRPQALAWEEPGAELDNNHHYRAENEHNQAKMLTSHATVRKKSLMSMDCDVLRRKYSHPTLHQIISSVRTWIDFKTRYTCSFDGWYRHGGPDFSWHPTNTSTSFAVFI